MKEKFFVFKVIDSESTFWTGNEWSYDFKEVKFMPEHEASDLAYDLNGGCGSISIE